MTTYRFAGRRKWGPTLALALASFSVLAGPAKADINGFQGGDGDQLADCVAPSDWQCLPREATLMARDGVGAGDDTFAEGSKEDAPQTWAFTGGRASGKADVRAVWTHLAARPDGRTFLDVAFARVDNTGDTYLGLELNQSRATWTNAKGASIPCRTDGDVLVSYEVRNPPAIALYEWSGTAGTSGCPDGAYGRWNAASMPAGSAETALNLAGPIDNFLAPDALGDSFLAGTFGEAALDLRGLADAVDHASSCEYFRTLTVKTRSSGTVSSSLQDWVDGSDVMARSCESPSGGDVTAPGLPSIGAPSAGAEACGPDVTLSGTAEPGSMVTVYDGAVAKEFAPAGSDGTWSVTVPGLGDGAHSFSAEATDDAGNTSERSPAVAFTVDADAPQAPTLEAAISADAVVLSGTAEPGSSVAISRDGEQVGTVTTDAAGAWSLTLAASAGAHIYTATASDACHTGAASAPVTIGDPADTDTGTGTGTGLGTGSVPVNTGTGVTPGTGTATGTGTGTGTATGTTVGAGTTGLAATSGLASGDLFPSAIDMGRAALPAKACALKPFKAYVRMKGVRQVRFMVDGRTVKVTRRADKLGQYIARIDPYKLAAGSHTLTARVTFRSKGRKAKTLTLRFRRCDQCQSRRSFPIRVKNLRNGERAVSAVVYVNGKRAKVIRGKRLRSRVVLVGLPKGTYTVRIVTRTNRGRTSTDVRRYRTCVPKAAAR